jgi:uncharacterized membrane protein YidH (DUF202 family)
MVALLLIVLGDVLIIASLYLHWFTFAGTADYDYGYGHVWVSGSVSAFGMAANSSMTQITMWSSSTVWSTAGSDFWFGYLIVAGILLISASALLAFYRFIRKEKQKIFEVSLLAVVITAGCLLAASASLITMLYYKPYVFVISGQIYGVPPPFDVVLLYASEATVKVGIGPWISLLGALMCIIGGVLQVFHRETWWELKNAN